MATAAEEKKAAAAAKKAAAAAGSDETAQRDAVSAQLNEKKVPHDPKAPLAELQTLLDAHTIPADRHVPKAGSIVPAEEQDGVEVGDPEELKPKVLPLVITPKGGAKDDEFGGWHNAAAFSHARVLNAYAYKNPRKWKKKKNVLVAQLVELNGMNAEDAAEKLATFGGVLQGVSFTDQRLQ